MEVRARMLQVVLPLNIPLKIAMPTDVAIVGQFIHGPRTILSMISAEASEQPDSRPHGLGDHGDVGRDQVMLLRAAVARRHGP